MPPKNGYPAPGFGRWLRDLKGERSNEQMAIALRYWLRPLGFKVAPSQIAIWEKGRVPDWAQLGAVSRVYGVCLDELLDRIIDSVDIPVMPGLLRDLPRRARNLPTGREKSEPETIAMHAASPDVPASLAAGILPPASVNEAQKATIIGAGHTLPEEVRVQVQARLDALDTARHAYESAAADIRALATVLGQHIARFTKRPPGKHPAGTGGRESAKSRVRSRRRA